MQYIDEFLIEQSERCFAVFNGRYPESEAEKAICVDVAKMLKESVYQTGVYDGKILAAEALIQSATKEMDFPKRQIIMYDSWQERKLQTES